MPLLILILSKLVRVLALYDSAVCICRETRCEIRINEIGLLVVAKYKRLSKRIRGVVNSKTRYCSKHLTSLEVTMEIRKHCLCRYNVVIAILSNTSPVLFRHRFIPRILKLVVMQTQLYLPLLQTLLVSSGREVVNIRVRHVPGFVERIVLTATVPVDDLIAHLIQFLNRISRHSSVQNQIVVSKVVEANELMLAKLLNLISRRIDHRNARGFLALKYPLGLVIIPMPLAIVLILPVHEKQIREYLNVEEDNSIVYVSRFAGF